jgi:hypothetical protein
MRVTTAVQRKSLAESLKSSDLRFSAYGNLSASARIPKAPEFRAPDASLIGIE